MLGDIDAVPGLSEDERAEFLATLNRAFDGKVEAIGWGHDGPAIRKMLKANALPHQEAFLVGAGMGHQVLGEAAGLPLTKDIETWFALTICPHPEEHRAADASRRMGIAQGARSHPSRRVPSDAPQDEVSAVLRSHDLIHSHRPSRASASSSSPTPSSGRPAA